MSNTDRIDTRALADRSARLVRRLGVRGAARRLHISRHALAALLAEAATPATVAIAFGALASEPLAIEAQR